ncbi:MAG: COQ9 family protein [Emcibacter sp.]|nr:COQ9 family protein [Emcibacter sp.]
MAKINTDVPDKLRAPLLQAALIRVPFEGWSEKTISRAARDINIKPTLAQLAFPGGALSMIDLLSQQQDQRMVDICTVERLAPLKIREKITLLVRSRIESEKEIRETVRNSVIYLALPINYSHGLKILYRTVDLMWKTINDPSTDFNYYTKRLTLAGVYSSVLLYWLSDESDDYVDTWDFLDRQIANVMQFEKIKAKIRNLTNKIPDKGMTILDNMSKLRYP